jgi:hypothetical protein
LRGNHTHVISQAGAIFVMNDTRVGPGAEGDR